MAPVPPTPEPRTCVSCGRTITWRKKWARDWDQVRYCSQACRRRKVGPTDQQLETAVLELLTQQTSQVINTPEGKAELKKQIKKSTAKLLHHKVTDVLFTEFVVQF